MGQEMSNQGRETSLQIKVSSTDELNTKLSMCQLSGGIVLSNENSIVIPKGFARIPEQPITWNISIDRHNLKAVAYEVSVPGTAFIDDGNEIIDTMVTLYQVRIVGVLYYNIAFGKFAPLKPTGTDSHGSKYTSCGSVFTTGSSISVNFVVGYVSSLDEIRPDLIDQLVYTVEIDDPTIVVNGRDITFNPEFPELVYSEFNGLQDIVVNHLSNIIIATTPIIS